MVQAAFEFSPTPVDRPAEPSGHQAAAAGLPADALDRTGFEIGRDHARHRLTPPLRHLHGHNPVRQGWEHGRALFGARTLRASAAVRQWLALRLEAWQHGQGFEEVQVNPAFLAAIDAAECPVTRQTLTLYADRDADATVLRLNTGAAYAAGNLAVVARQAARARSAAGDWAAALARARQLEAGTAEPGHDGLDAAAWLRLAVLASFATPLPHAQAAALPLCVLPPNRVRVLNPVQALQLMLTLQFTAAGYARRLMALSALAPGHEPRQAFQIFMHTLLARRLAAGPLATPAELRRTLEDSWTDPLVQRRWQRLAGRLSAADCGQWLQRAAARGLVVGGGRWLSEDAATEGWGLAAAAPTQPVDGAAGAPRRLASDAPPRPAAAAAGRRAPQAAAGQAASRPGKLRSRGSQNLAS